MKIKEMDVEIWDNPDTLLKGLKHIERAARCCYEIEEQITDNSWKNVIYNVLSEDKDSTILEHYQFIIEYDNLLYGLCENSIYFGENENVCNYPFLEAIKKNPYSSVITSLFNTRIYTNMKVVFHENEQLFDALIKYAEIPDELRKIWHIKITPTNGLTVKINCPLGTAYDFVCHNNIVRTQCLNNYGDEIDIYVPDEVSSAERQLYIESYYKSAYIFDILKKNIQVTPKILPTTVMTEILLTANLAQWDMVLNIKPHQSSDKEYKKLLKLLRNKMNTHKNNPSTLKENTTSE